MTGAAVAIRSNSISKTSSSVRSIQHTWAAYVRGRWPRGALCEMQREWDLTEGEARNVLYGHASLNVIDKIGRHRNGGWRLELDMLLNRWSASLNDLADQHEREVEHARQREEARRQSEKLALSRLARDPEHDEAPR